MSRKDYDEGYDEGYGAGLEDAGARVPLLVSIAVFFIIFGLGWLAGHFG